MNPAQKMRIAVILIGVLLIIVAAGDKIAPIHPILCSVVAIVRVAAFIGGVVCIVSAVRNG